MTNTATRHTTMHTQRLSKLHAAGDAGQHHVVWLWKLYGSLHTAGGLALLFAAVHTRDRVAHSGGTARTRHDRLLWQQRDGARTVSRTMVGTTARWSCSFSTAMTPSRAPHLDNLSVPLCYTPPPHFNFCQPLPDFFCCAVHVFMSAAAVVGYAGHRPGTCCCSCLPLHTAAVSHAAVTASRSAADLTTAIPSMCSSAQLDSIHSPPAPELRHRTS